LKAFAAVVERASFARAADRLGLSPSALSRTIPQRGKKFEMAVEGPLISTHPDVVIEGALQGLGILYAYDDDRVDEAVARGRLKR
jgi:hypothetical protein